MLYSSNVVTVARTKSSEKDAAGKPVPGQAYTINAVVQDVNISEELMSSIVSAVLQDGLRDYARENETDVVGPLSADDVLGILDGFLSGGRLAIPDEVWKAASAAINELLKGKVKQTQIDKMLKYFSEGKLSTYEDKDLAMLEKFTGIVEFDGSDSVGKAFAKEKARRERAEAKRNQERNTLEEFALGL